MKARLFSAAAVIWLLWCACAADAASEGKLGGTVVYKGGLPAGGAVVYALDRAHRLEVSNNNVMIAEHIPRAITDVNGRFVLNHVQAEGAVLFVRDLEDNCAFYEVPAEGSSDIKCVIHKPSSATGHLLKGNEPVKGQTIRATYLTKEPVLKYVHTYVTDAQGLFQFKWLMPGEYMFQVIEEVPQVGCCFRSVVTKQVRSRLKPGEQGRIQLGGTNLPFLAGRVTDSRGGGLHGVWVRLESAARQGKGDAASENDMVVWSDVTGRDGSYRIFDVPAGEYTMHCFRRLAANNSSRTIQATKQVTVADSNIGDSNRPSPVGNIFNVAIDVEAFMPLKYDQPAPRIKGELLDGRLFNLSDQRDKIVIVYFYASWCKACAASAPEMDRLAEQFERNHVIVLGVNLDDDIETCRQFVSDRKIKYSQLFSGPWAESELRKAYHVVDVPSSFVIDKDGRIAQIDLFGDVLRHFIEELLKKSKPPVSRVILPSASKTHAKCPA